MPDNKDPETLKIEREGQAISDFVKSTGWEIAKGLLIQKLNLLDSLSSTIFENKTPEQVVVEMQARASSVQIVRDWINEVEGTAHQHLSNNQPKPEEETIIVRY